VCRDFAVLGYCEKGLECAHNHVHECPDFAESGKCTTKGCKLPHVIRANRKKAATSTSTMAATSTSAPVSPLATTWNQQQQQTSSGKNISSTVRAPGSIGAGSNVANSLAAAGPRSKSASEEFISLTFHESSDEEDDEDVDEGENDEDEESGGEEVEIEESDEEDAQMHDAM